MTTITPKSIAKPPYGSEIDFSQFEFTEVTFASIQQTLEGCKPGPHYVEALEGGLVIATSLVEYPDMRGEIACFTFKPPIPIGHKPKLFFRYYRMERVDLSVTAVAR